MKYFAYCSMTRLRIAILFFTVVAVCTACGKSEKTMSKSAAPVYISGNIFGEEGEGPIKKAKLTATDKDGTVRATSNVNGSSHYSLKLPTDTAYPVIISAIYPRSTKIVESGKGEVKAAVLEPSSAIVELSPRSTTIVDIALARGGLTPENFEHASASALRLGHGAGGMAYHGGH
jgi:hypothetical protein